ncbi:MAG: RNA polymerase sigma factor [Acidimicrobiales bacterium]
MTGENLDQVVDAAKLGEQWALTALYRRLHPSVVRFLQARVSAADAEDVASEAWIDVARGLPRFEGDGEALRRFVFTIARRRAIDWGRRRARRRTDPVDVEVLSRIGGRADTEAAALDNVDGDEAVRRIVAMLPAEQAEVVLLRVVGGFSVAEVAEVIGRRPAHVSVVQHRALRRLARGT